MLFVGLIERMPRLGFESRHARLVRARSLLLKAIGWLRMQKPWENLKPLTGASFALLDGL